MSELKTYARSVKNVESKNIITLISTVDVGAKDIIDNINRLKAEGLMLTVEAKTWAITKNIVNGISKSIPGMSSDEPILDVLLSGASVISNVTDNLKKDVLKYNQKIWSGEDMTVRQVYLLSTIEQMEFWNRYTNKLLDALLSMSQETSFTIDKYLTKNEMMFINGQTGYFTNISISLLKGKSILLKEIDSIPELDVDDEASLEIMLGMGGKKPELNRGFGIHVINPVYWYNEAMRSIDLWRIRSAQDDNEFLAMKINQAINKKNGSDDASLDRRIEVYRDKILKNSQKIDSIVSDYA